MKTILILLCTLITVPLFSQTQQKQTPNRYHKNIFVEGLGASLISLNYDMRLQRGRMDGFGFRAGIGYKSGEAIAFNPNSANFLSSDKINIYVTPLEVNYILGGNGHSLIAGAGVLPSYFNYKRKIEGVKNQFYFMGGYFSLGYRYQHPSSGLMFQLNWNPLLLRNGNSNMKWGGISIGYGF